MTFRTLNLAAVAASALLVATTAVAHDAHRHDASGPQAKAKPTTCAQLADRERYSNDLADADIKALKAKCDAARKASGTAPKADAKGN